MLWVVVILFSFSLLYIFLFSLGQLHLTWIYLRHSKKVESVATPKNWPDVTIQLPIYNEKYVVERLLRSVTSLDYDPRKLEIQILDDSNDETTELLLRQLESLRQLGLDIKLIHRENRLGFKAGALEHGLKTARGEFIAIFDADFMPDNDFLIKTIPHFEHRDVGMVQTRWGHVNRDYSTLTRLQAFGLDAHFSIEQVARNAHNSFINFNGTCGVWRKACIEEAGGWSHDTLTEDLDLSYRAQLKGWKFKYLEGVETPGELPVLMPSIKTQQFRWNKGAAETAKKHFINVSLADLPLTNKVHAFFHLFNSTVFVSLFVAAVLSIPMLYIKDAHPEIKWLFNMGLVFLIGFFSIAVFYWIGTQRVHRNSTSFFILFPGFLIVSMGLSLHNGIAVMEGLLGRKTSFIRTPKFNILHKDDKWRKDSYLNLKLDFKTVAEGLCCLYFVFGIIVGISMRDFGLVFFHAMLACGFGAVFYYSVKPVLHGK